MQRSCNRRHPAAECVAAFRYSGTAGRTNKPFNPLLGETYELVCAEKGFRMLAEKVTRTLTFSTTPSHLGMLPPEQHQTHAFCVAQLLSG